MFALQRDSTGWRWMVRGSGWVLESGWGLGQVIERMGEEYVKLQVQMRRRKVGKVEATQLHMQHLDQEVPEIHIVQSGQWGTRWETNPIGQV